MNRTDKNSKIPAGNSLDEMQNIKTTNQSKNYMNNNQTNKSLCMNTYYEHQQLYQQKQPIYNSDMSSSVVSGEQNFPSPPTVAKSLTSTNSPKKNSELVDNSGLFANNTKLTKSDSPIDVSNKNNKNISSISISLSSGDRVIMNNTAGSRKPLTGFSF